MHDHATAVAVIAAGIPVVLLLFGLLGLLITRR
jgi:nitrate reductase gamma subunit